MDENGACAKKTQNTYKKGEGSRKTGQIKKTNYPAGSARDPADSWIVWTRRRLVQKNKKLMKKIGENRKKNRAYKKINYPAGSAQDPADSCLVAGGLEWCRCAPLVVCAH